VLLELMLANTLVTKPAWAIWICGISPLLVLLGVMGLAYFSLAYSMLAPP
jgi:hypothetical protein